MRVGRRMANGPLPSLLAATRHGTTPMSSISPVTRRDIRDAIGHSWSGRLTPSVFLNRLYNLNALPSNDDRYSSMLGDVLQHTENNSDWPEDWIFDDGRLALDDDVRLLRLLTEVVHPEVLPPGVDAASHVAAINRLLLPDGFELFPAAAISGRPVYSWRSTTPRKPPLGDFPSSVIAGLSMILVDYTSSTGIDSLFEAEDFPTPADTGSNKAQKVKAWLRAAQADPSFDHWAGLGAVLRTILETDDRGTVQEEAKQRIRDVLAKRSITYLDGGWLTTAPQTTLSLLPAAPHMPPEMWEKIGAGGFGTVYRATDPRLDIDFALKVLDPFPGLTDVADARARFVREAGLLFRLRHENIVRIYDAGELADGRPYIKMEYIDGRNLQDACKERQRSSYEIAVIIGRLAAAVDHAHGKSILHRDIKPSNVIVASDTNDVRLIDFGLGILVEESVARARLTTSSQQFGGVFAAPELLANSKLVDPGVDVYSLGAVWFWLHSGRSPQGAGLDDEIDSLDLDRERRTLMRKTMLPLKSRATLGELLAGLRNWAKAQWSTAGRAG